MKRKRYSRKFQRMAVERMRNSENVGDLAQELGVTRRCLYKWRAKLDLLEPGEESARPNTHESSYRKQAQQLKRLLAEKTLEVDFFQRCLAESRGSTPEERRFWRDGIYDQIREVMSLQGSLSIERMCELARVIRAGFYGSVREQRPVEDGDGSAVCDSADCSGTAPPLRLSTDHGGAAPTRNASEPQEGSADDAERQPTGRAATAVRDMFGANSKKREPQAGGHGVIRFHPSLVAGSITEGGGYGD